MKKIKLYQLCLIIFNIQFIALDSLVSGELNKTKYDYFEDQITTDITQLSVADIKFLNKHNNTNFNGRLEVTSTDILGKAFIDINNPKNNSIKYSKKINSYLYYFILENKGLADDLVPINFNSNYSSNWNLYFQFLDKIDNKNISESYFLKKYLTRNLNFYDRFHFKVNDSSNIWLFENSMYKDFNENYILGFLYFEPTYKVMFFYYLKFVVLFLSIAILFSLYFRKLINR